MNPPTTYCKGQKFLRLAFRGRNELYVLALVAIDRSRDSSTFGEAIMKLICLRTGDRWSSGVVVKSCTAVTPEEMTKLYSSGTFKPVDVEEIEVKSLTYTTEKVRLS